MRAGHFPAEVDVVIAGAGPTGLMAANLLGCAGVRTLVVERDAELSQLPRAVSVDDESMRALQAARLRQAAAEIVVEGTGTRYYGRRGQLLVYARGPRFPPYGHAVKNPIDQPEFDRMLHAGLAAHDNVDMRLGCPLLDVVQQTDDVRVATAEGTVTAGFVLGCDGGRSTVRALAGIDMEGMSFGESWIVIDTVHDPHDERFAMHHGDPRRPHVIVPGRDGRCRYEFLLLHGEDPEEVSSLAFVRRLLEPYRDVTEEQITRRTVYKFHALMAETFRRGRVFVLGDAAHMMPPFAGQGLNSGIRDAFNLSWKVALAVRGRAGDALLDTYEAERKPHAAAMVELSKRIGRVMMTTSARRAAVRDGALAAASTFGPTRRYFAEMRFKPPPRVSSVLRLDGGIAGAMLPQPYVLLADRDRVPLDDVLGEGFALLGVGDADLDSLHDPLWDALGARRVRVVLDDRLPRPSEAARHTTVADADGRLGAFLAEDAGRIVLVRPDRYVVGVFDGANERVTAQRVRAVLGARTLEQRAARDDRIAV